MKLSNILDKFSQKKILVIGDVMLDKYSHAGVTRISPEAPIQVATVEKETYIPGGAANSANNISTLGGSAYIIGVIGKDPAGAILKKELKKRRIDISGLLEENERPTTLKQRIVSQGQQLLRIDYEVKEDIQKKTEKELIKYIKNNIQDLDGIIISDYAKGMVTKSLARKTITLANNANIPIVVDPKPSHKLYYKNATIITPNEKEAREMAKMTKANIEKVGKKLLQSLKTTVLITRGEKGMALFKTDDTVQYFPTVAQEVYDVSGAGDTATAALTLALVAGSSLEEAVKLANTASGIVVGKIGTATTTVEEIKQSLNIKK